MTFKPGDEVTLPPHPPSRKNGKPKERKGVVVKSKFDLPGRVLVLEEGKGIPYWKPVEIVELISKEKS